ncbi:NAD(+)--rifampin ADP-ribosyltransferase [Quadrisphaera sp. KR29]|uniref:NAD(+)--rifampin ADP-ribosyltransferase n=1 Tax=Quadrisphaera sp. KR29 TaxID=3461391 RepID=UPI004043CC46
MTYEHCDHVTGPFFHGTRARVAVGEELVPGFRSNFREAALRHVYFTGVLETAVWGAELASALRGEAEQLGGEGRGHVYVVEPLGPFEDDPNVTDKKFPGNPTRSYRTLHPLRVLGEVQDWPGHSPEVLQGMLDGLARLREQGLDVIED